MISPLNVLLGLTLAVSTRAVDIVPAGQQVSIDPNGAYVRACHLADGSILAGYTITTDNGATKALPAAKSTDGGATWTNLGQVIQNQTSTAEIDNAFPLQLANGRILYGYRNHGKNPDGSFSMYRITLSYSDDNGTTWSYLSDVDERQATPTNNGLWEPFIRVAVNGEVQVYYSAESAALDQSILMKSSSDNGQTWSDSIVASTGATNDTRDGMAGVANLDDNGNLIMVFENTEIGPALYSIDCVFSSNDGATWTGRQRLFTPSASAGAPQVVKLGDTLVTSFQTYDGVPSGSQPNMEVVTSSDNGNTWNVDPGNITATGIMWPGLLAVDNSSFLALAGQGLAGGTVQLYDISA